MTDEQKAAYVNAQAAAAHAHTYAMIAANMEREAEGKGLAYTEKDFLGLLDEYGLHHNYLIGFFHNL